jgi:hypothetical protein
VAILRQHKPSFKWDEYDPYAVVPEADPALARKLDRVSNKAATAFALGCAEWTVYSLARCLRSDLAFQYIDAFWLWCCSKDVDPPPETEEDEWTGPCLGAVDLSLMTVLNTIIVSEDGPAGDDSAFASSIVHHVTPEKRRFLQWQSAVVDRIQVLFPRSDTDPDGGPVPREALDPNVSIDTLDLNAAAEQLKHLIYESHNPLLSDEDESDKEA